MVDFKSRWLNDTGLKPITADENPASLQALRRSTRWGAFSSVLSTSCGMQARSESAGVTESCEIQ
jgi:hypothetical protein